MVYDYSEKGTLKSIEGSLTRLNVDRLDFVWVHDVAQDFHGDGWLAQFEIARTGAFYALSQLRDEGVIKGWGLGVNRVEPIELTLGLTDVAPDAMLLAGRYTLLDHELALQRLMPAAAAQGVDIVIGGPYSSGVLAGGAHFDISRRRQRSPPRWSGSRRSLSAMVCRPKRPRCISCLPTPPSFRSFRVRADPNASQKIMQRSTPLFQKTFGARCAINTWSHPTRRCPSTDNRASGGDIGKRLHRGESARDFPDANVRTRADCCIAGVLAWQRKAG